MLSLYEDLSRGSCYLRIRREDWGKLKQIQGDLTTLQERHNTVSSEIMMITVIMIFRMALMIKKNQEEEEEEKANIY